jgi:hypothetical protein
MHRNQTDLPLFRPPPARRSALNGPGTALGQSRLSPPSPPIKTAGGPLPGAKTPPSGGGLTLPGVPPALSARLMPLLRKAGYVVPGHPAWRDPAELDGWFAAPRAELGGRAWAEVHVPFTLEDRMRFAHAMDQIDREIVDVPA